MKIPDIFLIIFLLVLSFIPLMFARHTKAKTAVITINNEPYKTVDLSVDDNFQIKTPKGENTVEIKNNSIAVISADCRDSLCVKSGAISKPGEVIACLPHKLLIEIKDEDD